MIGQSKHGDDRVLTATGGTFKDYCVSNVFGEAHGVLQYPERKLQTEKTAGKRRPCRVKKGAAKRVSTSAYEELDSYTGWPKPTVTVKTLEVGALLTALTPTKDMPRTLFLYIAMAAKSCGCTFQAFRETHPARWSGSLGDWEPIQLTWWDGLNNGTRHTLGEKFLVRCAIASRSLSEALVRKIVLEEAYDLDVSGMKRTVINQRYLGDAINQCTETAVVVMSALGTGKSTSLRQLAAQYSDQRQIYIVPTVSLSYSALSDLNKHDDVHYRHYRSFRKKDDKAWTCKHLLTTVQSLWKTQSVFARPYALVVFDEIQSILRCMLGETSKHHRWCVEQLEWILRHAKKVVFADACCTNAVREFVYHFFRRDVRFIINN